MNLAKVSDAQEHWSKKRNKEAEYSSKFKWRGGEIILSSIFPTENIMSPKKAWER